MANAEHSGGGSARGEGAGASKGEKSGGGKGEKSGGGANKGGGKEGSAGKGGGGNKGGEGGNKGGNNRGGGEGRGVGRDKDVGEKGREGAGRSGREGGGNKNGTSREKEKSRSGGERVGKGRGSDAGRNNNRADRSGQSAGTAQRGDTNTNRSPARDKSNAAKPDSKQGAQQQQSDRTKQTAARANQVGSELQKNQKGGGIRQSGLGTQKLKEGLGNPAVFSVDRPVTHSDGSVSQTVRTSDGVGHDTNYRATSHKDGHVTVEVAEVDRVKGEFVIRSVRGDRVDVINSGFLEGARAGKGDTSKNKTWGMDVTATPSRSATRPSSPTDGATTGKKPNDAPRGSVPQSDPPTTKSPNGPKDAPPKPEREPRGGLVGDFKDRPEKKSNSPAFFQPASHKNPPQSSDPMRVSPLGVTPSRRPEKDGLAPYRAGGNGMGSMTPGFGGSDGPNLELLFQGTEIQLITDQGHVLRTWPAVSGRPGSTQFDQKISRYGPIPEGLYSVSPGQTDYFSWTDLHDLAGYFGRGQWPGGPYAWGLARTPINSVAGTDTFGRSDMFIHGGESPGSAGCIDLTIYNNSFHEWFRAYGKSIQLRVEYPEQVWHEEVINLGF